MGVCSLTFVAQSKGGVMRSVIYGAIITVFLASAGTVQAANDLDGKALLCSSNLTYPVYGLVFDQGKVSRWQVDGYSKGSPYMKKNIKSLELKGCTGKASVGLTLTEKPLKLGSSSVQSLQRPRFSKNWMKSSLRQKSRIRFRS